MLNDRVKQSNAPLVTVVIATRNRAGYLSEAIDSIQRQSLDDWECIVVDDCSTDNTASFMQEIGDGRVQTIRMPRRVERSAVRNVGWSASHAELILFLDDDDRLMPNALSALSAALRRNQTAVAAIGAKVVFDSRGHTARPRHPRRELVRSIWPDVLVGWQACPGQVMFRVDSLRRAGGWDERFVPVEDVALLLSVSHQGRIAVIPDIVLEYRLHSHQAPAANAMDVFMTIRNEFVDSLPESERAFAARRARVFESLAAGLRYFGLGFGRRAAVDYWKGLFHDPTIFASPLLRPAIWPGLKMLMSAGVGRRGTNAVRRLKEMLRESTRHNPWHAHSPAQRRVSR